MDRIKGQCPVKTSFDVFLIWHIRDHRIRLRKLKPRSNGRRANTWGSQPTMAVAMAQGVIAIAITFISWVCSRCSSFFPFRVHVPILEMESFDPTCWTDGTTQQLRDYFWERRRRSLDRLWEISRVTVSNCDWWWDKSEQISAKLLSRWLYTHTVTRGLFRLLSQRCKFR